jgi:hypothetical protein
VVWCWGQKGYDQPRKHSSLMQQPTIIGGIEDELSELFIGGGVMGS